ncbi:unnamed protein product [Rhizoctonia solani]|uniref:Uncharacterized protein n=3 Tax=Rhizoctonia solani TaxID=456999 RepID=A0A8H3CWG4_9AGAM|nr:hypothetical protein RSOL_191380 [Rhizoctonia solani AG-3 Rhs1AP]KEP52586.1 hypothetical protein V565_043020 [Rhizoctonia solani 123E]CAE6342330.1 unnamed protein product [Rhizoctonia solani]CAE6493871.1 unnamed protein product [Rhizoctonia solani]
MFDIQSLDCLLDRGISGSDVHTVVISDPNGATLTFVDTIDATSETRNRRVRVVAALGIDAWRESVTTNLARDTLAPGMGTEEDHNGAAAGRVECKELGRVLTLPVHGSVTDALDPVLLVTLNGSQDAPWSTLQEKGYAVVEHLNTSISSIGDGLKSGQTPPMKYSQPRAR